MGTTRARSSARSADERMNKPTEKRADISADDCFELNARLLGRLDSPVRRSRRWLLYLFTWGWLCGPKAIFSELFSRCPSLNKFKHHFPKIVYIILLVLP